MSWSLDGVANLYISFIDETFVVAFLNVDIASFNLSAVLLGLNFFRPRCSNKPFLSAFRPAAFIAASSANPVAFIIRLVNSVFNSVSKYSFIPNPKVSLSSLSDPPSLSLSSKISVVFTEFPAFHCNASSSSAEALPNVNWLPSFDRLNGWSILPNKESNNFCSLFSSSSTSFSFLPNAIAPQSSVVSTWPPPSSIGLLPYIAAICILFGIFALKFWLFTNEVFSHIGKTNTPSLLYTSELGFLLVFSKTVSTLDWVNPLSLIINLPSLSSNSIPKS